MTNCVCQYLPGIPAVHLFAAVPAEMVFRRGISAVQEDPPEYRHVVALVQRRVLQGV